MALKNKFAWSIIVIQLLFIVFFAVFVKYGKDLDASHPSHNRPPEDGGQKPQDNSLGKDYPMFQDVNTMIFLGIGYLYAFLKKYGYSGVGMNFLLCAISVQWGIIARGCWLMEDGKMELSLLSLFKGEFAAASGVIALGGIFGKVGLFQMVVFIMIEVLVYSVTNHLRIEYLQVSDVGESVVLHLFAAIFGCAAAYTLDKKANVKDNPNEGNSYSSNLYCMLGSIVLWIYWPSFNAATDEGDSQHRCVINTFFALLGSGITCFAISALLHKDNKLTMSHIQNGALAGAVGVGSTSDLMIQPSGALAIGVLSACICVLGFKFFSPFLARLKVYDPCGINSLHGLPGLFAGILGIGVTFLANTETYGYSLYKFYPAMAPLANTTALSELQRNATITIEPGLGRNKQSQALYQFIYIISIMIISCISGLATGAILRMKMFDPIDDKNMYLDNVMWDLTEVEVEPEANKTEPETVSNIILKMEKL